MRRIVSKGALLFFMLCFIVGFGVHAQSADDVRQIHHILDVFEDAYIEEDVGMLGDILSDSGYIMVSRNRDDPENARIHHKEQLLSGMRHMFTVVDYLEHSHSDRSIEFHGPVAVVESVLSERMKDGSRRQQNSYHICARENGTWKVVFTSFLLAE